jgi:hypothetical protein
MRVSSKSRRDGVFALRKCTARDEVKCCNVESQSTTQLPVDEQGQLLYSTVLAVVRYFLAAGRGARVEFMKVCGADERTKT